MIHFLEKSIFFINTRPVERAIPIIPQAWTQYQEFYLPLLALTAQPLDDVLKQQFLDLLKVDVIVVVSPMAVTVGMTYLQQLGIGIHQLTHMTWVAVGERTAQCLAEYGISAQCPEIETSEGMFQLPIFKNQQHIDRVAFWRGEGGRKWLMQQLSDQGLIIDNFLLYKRSFPQSSQQQWQEIQPILKTFKQIVVLISSGESWQNWLNLHQNNPSQLANYDYFILGQRVFDQIKQSSYINPNRLHMLSTLNVDMIQTQLKMIALEE